MLKTRRSFLGALLKGCIAFNIVEHVEGILVAKRTPIVAATNIPRKMEWSKEDIELYNRKALYFANRAWQQEYFHELSVPSLSPDKVFQQKYFCEFIES